VVFGKVTKGMEVVESIAMFGTMSGKPKATVRINDCGVVEKKMRMKFGLG
jgi:cyclophilin family peptidyl-prolyl cis-trans isomerase